MTDQPADDRRALLQSALLAIDELQARVDRHEAATHEPIAIVGLGCRFPGGATTPDAYWDLLHAGRDAVTEYPAQRRSLVEASGVDLSAFDSGATWFGGFLDEIDQFDPQFFGISPREAATMDPQQRLALEVAWEALERAGIAPDSLSGSATGVFLGITTNEYIQLAKMAGADALDVYSATGGALNAAAGRIAYTLGLQGPCMAIDTACSSSLVAVHQACRSLRSGESDLALAGGVNLLLLPEAFVCFERWGMMAADGRCKTFDASADGFVRGEGCGIVVLKRLSDALAAGDPVLASIRGSAVNQDGRSSGLTVPSGLAQQAVIERALADGRVEPGDVQYFEAHGTGTTLGDPIEVEAIGAALGRGRSGRPLTIGSVKTNIGHLESGAGIAGVIKVVLAMQHGEIPPSLHFQRPSERIPWPAFPLVVPTAPTPWPESGGRRLAGVSGFGFSGTNAHLVIESAPEQCAPPADSRPGRVVVLGARSPEALRTSAAELARWLDTHPDAVLADVSRTLRQVRSSGPHRAGIVASDVPELAGGLRLVAQGGELPAGGGVARATGRRGSAAFLFTGQGSQYAGMAHELYRTEPVVRDAIDRCCEIVDPLLPDRLADVVFAEPGLPEAARLDQTGYTQPALFVVEYALAELWRSWGVVPSALLGHSIGELVAATVAGVFDLDDALALVVARATLMQALPDGGTMAAIMAPVDDVRPHVDGRPDVAIAAVNGPAHTVVSGLASAVGSVTAAMSAGGAAVQSLAVSHAFHSPLMEPMLDEFARVARSITYRAPSIPLVSNVSGGFAGDEVASAEYWVEHVRAPVRYADGLATLRAAGHDAVLELGPHPVLTAMGRSAGLLTDAVAVGSLRRGRSDVEQTLAAAATLGASGVRVDWNAVRSDGRRVALPTSPFERRHCWLDPAPAPRRPARQPGDHPLLGMRLSVPTVRATVHHAELGTDAPPWLGDHRLAGTAVVPATAYVEAVLAAVAPDGVIDSLSITAPLLLPDVGTVAVQTVVTEVAGGRDVRIVSLTGDGPSAGTTEHARALVRPGGALDGPPAIDPVEAVASFDDEIDVGEYYRHLAEIGLDYGPAFRGLTRLARRDRTAIGRVALPTTVGDADRCRLHPALFDACFHVLGVAVAPFGASGHDDIYVPVGLRGVRVLQPAQRTAWCLVTQLDDEPAGAESHRARVVLHDELGHPVAVVDELEVRRTSRLLWSRDSQPDLVHEIAWRASDPASGERAAGGRFLLLPDRSGVADELCGALTDVGASCTVFAAAPRDAAAFADAVTAAGAGSDEPVAVVDLRALDLDRTGDGADAIVATAESALGGALELCRAAALLGRPTRVVLVTRGAQSPDGDPPIAVAAALWGFARVVTNELPQLGCTCIDLDPAADRPVEGLARELLLDAGEDAVALRGAERLVPRLTRTGVARPGVPGPSRMVVGERGSFGAIERAPLVRRSPGDGELEIEVRATGLNFRDVLNVLGMFPGEPGSPGLECAGVVTEVGHDVAGIAVGDRVVGIAPSAFDSHVVTRADLVVPTPPTMSDADAAALPVAFATALHGLRDLAGLRAGERVLVHAAAGGVGLAAVQIALAVGAEVFATVGSARKRRVLEAMGVRHIYSSRTLDFADEVRHDTGGAGVDVVLNSLSDSFVDRSVDVLCEGGRFLEIGKRGIWTVEQFAAARPDVSYHPYDLADIAGDAGALAGLMRDVIDAIEAGRLAPLPVRAFDVDDAAHAFRYMAQARHIGKVVVVHRRTGPAVRPDGAYLITGGLGGVGLALAEWLGQRGAARVVVCGRSAPSEAAETMLSRIREGGTDVRVVTSDVSTRDGVAAAIAATTADGGVMRGVFHAAGVLDDGALPSQTWERFRSVLAPKIVGAAFLDEATRAHPLDHFVLFSSSSAVLGAPGQSAYAAANRALDAIAQRRRSAGLPAVSVGWGPWADVGMAARLTEDVRRRHLGRGVEPIHAATALEVLGRLLDDPRAHVLVIDADWQTLVADASTVPRLLAEVAAPDASSTAAGPDPVASLVDEVATAPEHARRGMVHAAVLGQVGVVLGIDPTGLDEHVGLTDLGMDSLMAVELANRLADLIRRPVPATVPFEHPSPAELAEHVIELLSPLVEFPALTAGRRDADGMTQIVDLEIDDLADALLKELDDAGY